MAKSRRRYCKVCGSQLYRAKRFKTCSRCVARMADFLANWHSGEASREKAGKGPSKARARRRAT